MSQQPAGRSLGHAFTFVRRRLRLAAAVPIVPVLLNTYFPPNVPSPGRCWRLGQALRAGIESWEPAARVAVFASGGLSHFVVIEDLDRSVLAGLENGDAGVFEQIPVELMRSGTSETLNWITAGGALGGLAFDLVDYIPAYRSPAGTGVGMAFATWGEMARPRQVSRQRPPVRRHPAIEEIDFPQKNVAQEWHSEGVGSLLRPPELIEARRRRAAGELGAAEFKRIEDAAVESAIGLQENAGLDVIARRRAAPGVVDVPVRRRVRRL